jgi:hypothetical protein
VTYDVRNSVSGAAPVPALRGRYHCFKRIFLYSTFIGGPV